MPYRLIYSGLILIGLAAIAIGVLLNPEGDQVDIPGPIESVSPAPGSQVPPQASVVIDLQVGYEAEIVIDGWPITDSDFVQATGVYRWSPNPGHPTISEWAPGEHTVRITWNTFTGLPDTGSFEWSFRVG
jgi:hypothetical protein